VLVYCAGEKGNISETIESINQIILRRVVQNMVKRANVCLQNNVGQCSAFYEVCFRFYCIVVL
jgi:hypothetical protein